jgi:hypothetical protein
MTRRIPRSLPKFHKNLILPGVGYLINDRSVKTAHRVPQEHPSSTGKVMMSKPCKIVLRTASPR